MPDEKAIADKIAADAKAAAKDAAKTRDEQLAAQRKASDEDTQAQLDRVANLQPTPTQEENDRAKLGLHSVEELDDKVSDGSPEEGAGQRNVSTAATGTAGSTNRSVSTK